MSKPNQDIRDYMADHGVSQRMLASEIGVSQFTINKKLQTELSQKDKEAYLNLIDAIAAEANRRFAEYVLADEPRGDDEEFDEDVSTPPENSCITVFQIGDRVKIPSKSNKIGTVCDIWQSMAKAGVMYAVEDEAGNYGMYAENQLEPAPIPIEYSFGAHIDGNVAVVTMHANQGEKSWVYARGHAHILHDGEVGLAQAISFASKRMFESLDTKQENKIYFK